MKTEKALAKIEKATTKKKSKDIIALMNKAEDSQVLVKALEGLAQIADEDSCNMITHFFNNEDKAVRLTACKAGIGIGTEYMKTRVRHQLAIEQDAEIKKQIQEAFNNANK